MNHGHSNARPPAPKTVVVPVHTPAPKVVVYGTYNPHTFHHHPVQTPQAKAHVHYDSGTSPRRR